ncbi:hypothetical protein C8E83_0033 [Frondihabitans australicus]|uniref:Uncharacterized protein n=1 Tax=Frondihabitans australicus TaxID=386892 RepID=A0A495ICC1_9MICO|nr:hypothetical protein C8E83_0033 [Frondihabitans australicus]
MPVRHGVFVATDAWGRLDADQQYLLRVRAAALKVEPRHVASHASALAVHGLTSLHAWPRAVHLTDPDGGRGQSRTGLVKHAGPLDETEIESIDGIRVTSPMRTCLDLAVTAPFEITVASVDQYLRSERISHGQLMAAFERSPIDRGRALAERALRFANDLSDSAGESWCRCILHDLGAPTPIQQKEFRDARGRIAFVDLWFESCGVIVEFDGDQKYFQPRFAKGRTVSEIIVDERKRERRLLALPEVRDVVRVEWKNLLQPWQLRVMATDAGIPLG